MKKRRWNAWWFVATWLLIGAVGIPAYSHLSDRKLLVMGVTSVGHRLVELECEACHQQRSTPSKLCRGCHEPELADDVHPASLFDNQERWGAVLANLDARECVTCHAEHRDGPMGFTRLGEVCSPCHGTITTDSISHAGLRMDSCLDCHNYHYEASIDKAEIEDHLADPDLLDKRLQRRASRQPNASTTAGNAPPELRDAAIEEAWKTSAHASGNANCDACHSIAGTWVRRPSEKTCIRCHAAQVRSFYAGKHGVRSALGYDGITPGDPAVELPMHAAARSRVHGCHNCHGVHALDLERARVSACLECHADDHSKNYLASPHGVAYTEFKLDAPTCATCHMPLQDDETGSVTSHNNSLTMRPPERMLGAVCIRCHGLAYSWAYLRDAAAIRSNFQKAPPPQDALMRKYVDMVRAFGETGATLP